jgi:hypothetical protein
MTAFAFASLEMKNRSRCLDANAVSAKQADSRIEGPKNGGMVLVEVK